jgi:large subunit ribosomal protein L18e
MGKGSQKSEGDESSESGGQRAELSHLGDTLEYVKVYSCRHFFSLPAIRDHHEVDDAFHRKALLKASILEPFTQCRESQDMKKITKTDPNLVFLIESLKKKSREKGAAIWRDIALRLEKPNRNWAEVNLSKLERYTEEGEVIVVPGKVLGAGSLNKKLVVAAYKFSGSARKKIEGAGGKSLTIAQLVQEVPDGSGVTIMG